MYHYIIIIHYRSDYNIFYFFHSIIFSTQIEATNKGADGRKKAESSCRVASNGRFLYGIKMGFSKLG